VPWPQAEDARRRSRVSDLHVQRSVVAVLGLLHCPLVEDISTAHSEFQRAIRYAAAPTLALVYTEQGCYTGLACSYTALVCTVILDMWLTTLAYGYVAGSQGRHQQRRALTRAVVSFVLTMCGHSCGLLICKSDQGHASVVCL
jgi:hypothetical protein